MSDLIVMPTYSRFQDLTGQTFGRWTVLSYAGKRSRYLTWRCLCVCGEVKVIASGTLKSGHSKSCGCLQRELTAARARSHGGRGTSEYGCWKSMRKRCFSTKHKSFKDYGGRGEDDE